MGKVKIGLYCYLIADILTKVLQSCSLNSPLPNIWMFVKTTEFEDHRFAGSNPAGGEILPEAKRCFIAQSLSCSPFHRLEMTEILLKGRKTLTHPSN